MPAVFEYRHIVRDEEIDPQGHVNNAEYIRWMQSAALAHSSAQGWPPERYRELGCGWVARQHRIEYLRPAFAGEQIIVRTWVAGFRRVSSLRKYKIVRPQPAEDGADSPAESSLSSEEKAASSPAEAVLAVAETNWAFVGLERLNPRRIPPEVAGAFLIVPPDKEP